jgi:very-short-patch-repair endonuclease
VLRRYDLCYPDLRIIIEYDGRQHANDLGQWNTDIYRREELDDAGWRMIVVTAEGVYRKPEETLTRIRKVLADRRCPGLPRTISAAWRPHFPAPASA